MAWSRPEPSGRPAGDAPPTAHVFAVEAAELPAARWAEALAARLRRAVLGRLHNLRPDEELTSFFHGHAPDGGPLRSEGHRHLFHAAWASDPAGRLDRFAVIAPQAADRTVPAAEPDDLTRLAEALDGLDMLFAGPHGLLRLRPLAGAADDAVFGRSDRWASATVYRAGRRRRKRLQDLESIIAEDVRLECGRRGLPPPEVAVSKVAHGSTGGLRGWLRLSFTEPVEGPLLLGRHSHFGAGLFRADPRTEPILELSRTRRA